MLESRSKLREQLNQASRELKTCEERWSNIISKSRHGVLIVDTRSTIRFANQVATSIFGCRAEELLGRQFEIPAATDKRVEMNVKSLDGRTVPIEIWLVETEWSGEPAWFVALHDMTEHNQKEEELRKLSRAVMESPSMVMITDARGIIEYVNPKFTAVTGYTFAEAVGRNPSFLKSGQMPPEVYRELWETVAKGKEWRGEMINRKKNGEIYWESAAIAPVSDLDGKITNFIAVTEDITERKRMEEALRDSEELFRIIFDQASQLMGLLKPDGTLIRMNRTAADLIKAKGPKSLGKPAPFKALEPPFPQAENVENGVIGKPFWDTPWWAHSPELQERLRDAVRRASGGEAVRFEATHLTPEGEKVWVDFSLTPLSDEKGDVVLLVPEGRDITERRMAEEALRFSEARYRALYRDNPAMIITLDAELTILSVNPTCASQLGYTTDELVGQSVLKLFYEGDRPAVAEQLQLCLQNPDRVYQWQFHKVRKNGDMVWVEELARAVSGLHGVLNVLMVCQDITLRKQAEEEIEKLNTDLAARAAELEAANRELEAFSYTVSHDLRNPLTVINGYCQAIMGRCGEQLDAQCREYVEESYKGTLRMNRLIGALLDFSRLARCEVKPETVDLSALAREVTAELQLAEPERRMSFSIAGGVVARGDPSLLRVVLANLLGNACKYTSKRKEAVIDFGVTEIDGKPAYFVRDNGTGFDMTDAEKMFQPFQRLPGGEEFGGHGVGLATVERIIRRHGGRVWAEGEPGKGAAFYFTL
jgi:PAS domain S-box-containing protein